MLHFKEMQWCWNNGVKFSPFPLVSDGSILKILKSENGNETLGEVKYTPETVYKKIDQLYVAIYNKNNNNGKEK